MSEGPGLAAWLDPPPRRVAVLRALAGLGDLLCAVPALRALRQALPQAHIALIGLAAARDLVARYPGYVDELVELPGWPGLTARAGGAGRPEQVEQIPAFLAEMRRRDFDLAIQMHGSGLVSNPLVALVGARRTAGFHLPGQYRPDPSGFAPYPAHEPEIRRWLRLVEHLGLPGGDEQLEFPLSGDDERGADRILGERGLDRGAFAVVHPGAESPDRRWSPERFAEAADALAGPGLAVVLTGVAAEAPVTASVARLMRAPAHDLAGATGLGSLAALLVRARLVICNDTGVSHLAAAVRAPSVVVFTRSDPQRWAPLDRTRHRAVWSATVDHNPCQHGRPVEGHRCLRDGCTAMSGDDGDHSRELVPADAVVASALELLEGSGGSAA